jgi:hypothetical protein
MPMVLARVLCLLKKEVLETMTTPSNIPSAEILLPAKIWLIITAFLLSASALSLIRTYWLFRTMCGPFAGMYICGTLPE